MRGGRHGRPRQDEEAGDLHDPAVVKRVGHEAAEDPEPQQAEAQAQNSELTKKNQPYQWVTN